MESLITNLNTMTVRRIEDPYAKSPSEVCKSPDHNVPSHLYLTPGTYEHTCDSCGLKKSFTVQGTFMKTPLTNK